jgi:cytochrome c oxidase subunit IV
MEVQFSMAWGMIVILVAVIVIAGSLVALVFRRMQERLKSGG